MFRVQGIAPTKYSVSDTVQQNALHHKLILYSLYKLVQVNYSQVQKKLSLDVKQKNFNNKKFASYGILVA